MSGRSAYARKAKHDQADKRAYKEFAEGGHDDFGYTGPQGPPATKPHYQHSHSYMSPLSPPPHIRRRSHSSAGSAYGYPTAPHLHKPRPIVIASAIEKSDFRTHLDGMSSNLRGKLGGLIKGKKEIEKPTRRRPGTSAGDSSTDFDFQSRSTELTTPSLGALPSLAHSTVPSEGPGTLSSHASYSLPTRERVRQPQESVIQKIRRFEGGGKLPQLGWKSLSNNPELWDVHGDTFVYMYMRGSRTKPPPSFRVNSHVLEATGSKMFIDKLHNIHEPEGWPKFVPSHGGSNHDESSDYHSESYDGFRSSNSAIRSEDSNSDSDAILPIGGHRKPSMRAPAGIQYEIYIPWPGAETGIHSTIWHITTRNFFAVTYNASSLVGTTLHESLTKLMERLTQYPDYLGKGNDKVTWLTDYIMRHKFDDVRNNPSYAASLLAFSEHPNVQWREGYIEAFVHCVGMLDMGLQTITEWRYISSHTKMFLSNASMETEERIHRAQAWLTSFDFGEMWPVTAPTNSVARGCFDRLRKWFCKYYENAFLHWPPSHEGTWLSRDMVSRLRNDFYGLYDYLVDRDIIFDGAEYRPGQKWAITSRSGQNFRADTFELPFTDMLLTFDNRNDFPHIPHPYPITPPSVPAASKPKSSPFNLAKKSPLSPADIVAQNRRKSLSYGEASNVYILRDQYMHTDLVTNFIRFEQSDNIETLDPFEARRGRWLLIYGILQVLATVSVDSPNLRYKEGAQYHLNPQMKGIVPWAERGAPPEEEASHNRSHCWTVPATWGPAAPKARPNAHKPILWGQFGDGRVRGESMDSIPTTKQQTALIDGKTTTPAAAAAAVPAHNSIAGIAREASIGRKRAEEWVQNTPAVAVGAEGMTSSSDENEGEHENEIDHMATDSNQLQPGGNGGGSSPSSGGGGGSREAGVRSRMSRNASVDNTTTGTGAGAGAGTGSDEDEAMKAEARRRRALVHGFTDFQVPDEW